MADEQRPATERRLAEAGWTSGESEVRLHSVVHAPGGRLLALPRWAGGTALRLTLPTAEAAE